MLCGTPKTRHFSAFLSHFSKIIFEKRLIRQFQRLALCPFGVLVGEMRLAVETEKTPSQEKRLKMRRVPQVGARLVGRCLRLIDYSNESPIWG